MTAWHSYYGGSGIPSLPFDRERMIRGGDYYSHLRREQYRKSKAYEYRLKRYHHKIQIEHLARTTKMQKSEIIRQKLELNKNKNRQAAALKRVRDQNGKFQGLFFSAGCGASSSEGLMSDLT